MFETFRKFETTLAGRPLVIETGKMAQLASGSCLVRYGETVILCTATASAKPREGVDFFPMSVDYEEKMYSVGKIPGSFQRRESRPSEKAILTSRVIDRPIRPLFPKAVPPAAVPQGYSANPPAPDVRGSCPGICRQNSPAHNSRNGWGHPPAAYLP